MSTRGELVQAKIESMRAQVERRVAAEWVAHEQMVRNVTGLAEILDHLEDSGWDVRVNDEQRMIVRLSVDGLSILDLNLIGGSTVPCSTRTRPNFGYVAVSSPEMLGRYLDALRQIVPQRLAIEHLPDRIWESQSVYKRAGTWRIGPRRTPIIVNMRGLMRRESEPGWITAEEMVGKLEERSAELIAKHREPT